MKIEKTEKININKFTFASIHISVVQLFFIETMFFLSFFSFVLAIDVVVCCIARVLFMCV